MTHNPEPSRNPEPTRPAGGEEIQAEWQNPLAQSPDAEWTPDETDLTGWHVPGADSPDDVEELAADDPRRTS
ncbi:hypothetical protein ACFHYQ_13170 [Sphaerimonospora cavernae]|uniref:Uncharacterized protein n=1 Tax=Sphaerimonospora cavernae TaxID=1740611 RepID=A0ABV6U482_9ACTN